MEDSVATASKYVDMGVELLMGYGPKLVLAILTLIIGFKLVKIVRKSLEKVLTTQKVDPSLRTFLQSLLGVGLKIMVLISVAGMIGIQMTSFVALLGAAGLAVGLSLQGSLSNLAGGAIILFFKPFKVGDFIQAEGYEGWVEKIQIFNTILGVRDGRTVVIPNGKLSNNSLVNFNITPLLRVGIPFGISYKDNILKAKKILEKLAKNDERAEKEPAPEVVVKELGDNSVNLELRLWCKVEDHWRIRWDMLESGKSELEKAGLSIPFPQRDVHLYKAGK